MSASLIVSAILSTLNLQGQVTAESGDYEETPFEVPEGTVEIHVQYQYEAGGGVLEDVLDFGLRGREEMRGWTGGSGEDIIVGIEESVPGYHIGPIEAGEWAVVVGKARLSSESIEWTAVVEFHDEATLTPPRARKAPEPVTLSSEARWYAGDFHVHNDESGDSTASLDQVYDFARSQGLDFVALSNHNTTSGFDLQAAYQEDKSDLLFIHANEVTTYQGHGNAIGFPDIVDHRVGSEGRTAQGLIDEVVASGGVFAVNHPLLGRLMQCIGCSWEHETDWSKVGALEIHGGPYDSVIGIFTPDNIELWEDKLAEGHRIAAIGGSDDHTAGQEAGPTKSTIGSPTSYVYAESLSEAALLEGIKAGRTWIQLSGPEAPSIDVRLLRSDDSAAGTIGDTVRGESFVVEVDVEGGSGTRRVVLYENGENIALQVAEGETLRFEVEIPEEGARYHIEINTGLPVVLTSHFYGEFEKGPASDGSCGCRAGAPGQRGAQVVGVGLVLLACVSMRRRRS